MRRFALTLALLGLGGAAAAAPAQELAGRLHPGPDIKRVFVIIFENETLQETMLHPFFRKVAREGALLGAYSGVRHPSYPNYIALTSGSTWGIESDEQTTLDVTHLGDLLAAHGKSWKTYAEGYPGSASRCFLGAVSGKYARRHVPFLSFRDVQTHPERCARVVNAEALAHDISSGELPDFALYIPDNDDNGHDTGVGRADRWLQRRFGPLLEDPRFTEGTLLVLTFDEDDSAHGNHIYTALWGEGVKPGARSLKRYDHYSLLRTIEDILELGTLNRNDAHAAPITGIWR